MRKKGVPRLLAAAITFTLALGARSEGVAQSAGALAPLSPAMQQAATAYLPGVVGDPVPAFPITPDLAMLKPGTRAYQVVSGPGAGTTESHVIRPVKGGASGAQWLYTVGDMSAYLQVVPGESLSMVSETDADQGVLTRYSPPLPLLVAGMNAGDSETLTLQVSVSDLSDPDEVSHRGSLETTLTYIGAFRVSVPAGSFDAALLHWTFKGKIGPASIDDIQARFVVPEIGMVAAAEKRDVAAFLIYNDHTKVGRVLAQQP